MDVANHLHEDWGRCKAGSVAVTPNASRRAYRVSCSVASSAWRSLISSPARRQDSCPYPAYGLYPSSEDSGQQHREFNSLMKRSGFLVEANIPVPEDYRSGMSGNINPTILSIIASCLASSISTSDLGFDEDLHSHIYIKLRKSMVKYCLPKCFQEPPSESGFPYVVQAHFQQYLSPIRCLLV